MGTVDHGRAPAYLRDQSARRERASQTRMTHKDEERVVLERGMAEQDWRTPGYVRPLPRRPLLKRLPRVRLPDWTEEDWAKQLRLGVIILLVAGAALALLFASLKGFKAEGMSMEPTLHNGDHVIVNRLAYGHRDFGLLDWLPGVTFGRWARPGRGDIIVFQSPVEDTELVKRVVGLPGETVTIANGGVYINGELLSEPYANGNTACTGTDACTLTVPDDSYFVLGDNRANSLDSRGGWFVPLDNIAGKELLSY
jgi:signal peptidase I